VFVLVDLAAMTNGAARVLAWTRAPAMIGAMGRMA
jgi:hypothetical protein